MKKQKTRPDPGDRKNMIRSYAKYILVPVMLLFVLAGALVYSGAKLEEIRGSVSEEKVHLFTQDLLEEPVSDKVRDFILESKSLDEADRRTYKALNEMLLALALGIAFIGAWLAIGATSIAQRGSTRRFSQRRKSARLNL